VKDKERIAVTGAGAVSCFGTGVRRFFSSLAEGRSGIGPIERWDVSAARSRLAALVRDYDPARVAPASALRRLDLSCKYAAGAAAQALQASGLPCRVITGERIGVAAGTSWTGCLPVRDFLRGFFGEGMEGASPMLFPYTLPSAPASQLAILLELGGPNLTFCQKEASALAAAAHAADLLAGGSADAMLAGGAEDYSEVLHEAYDRLTALSPGRGGPAGSRPYDRTRNGFIAGEGAFFVVLERLAEASRRGADVQAYLAGAAVCHTSCGLHDWPADPAPLVRTMKSALEEAQTSPEEIGWVCSSANSTVPLDGAEMRAIGEIFGGRRRQVLVSSLKGALGEFGAIGGAHLVAACAAIRSGIVPPTAGTVDPEERQGFELVLGRARRTPLDAVLINAFASGGCLVSIVLKRAATARVL